MPGKAKHVALVLSLNKRFDRKVIEGVTRFVHEAGTWIVFLEDERAFREFTSGTFEFSAQAKAVAITAGASATASTGGSSAGASGGQRDATTVGEFFRGMATFTVARGGLMYEASIGGAKFKFRPL